MIERRERDLRRDVPLMVVGLVALVAVAVREPAASAGLAPRVAHRFLFGLAVGVTCSGVFRARTKQALTSTVGLAVGFALGALLPGL